VTVVAGQTANVEVKLEVESQNLQVLVTAERASGEAEAVIANAVPDNILQVLPADVLRSLPNAKHGGCTRPLAKRDHRARRSEGKYVQIRGTEPRLANVTSTASYAFTRNPACVKSVGCDSADIVESVEEINKTCKPTWIRMVSVVP